MNTFVMNDDALLRHALVANEAARREAPPLELPILKVMVCIVLILAAAAAEVFSATIGFRAAFPQLSDGTSLADAILPMRYAIAAYMLLGHVVLRGIIERFGRSVKWLFDGLGLIALLLMLAGMACFQFSGTYSVTGSPDEQGSVIGMAGPALGMLCGTLFTVSFLAAHAVAGKLIVEVSKVAAAFRIRGKLAIQDQAIRAVQTGQARVAVREAVIAEMSRPDALAERAAIEAADAVAPVAARAHELLSQRRLYDGIALSDEDDAPMRDIPLAALERRYADVARYDFAHFFTLLTKDARHA